MAPASPCPHNLQSRKGRHLSELVKKAMREEEGKEKRGEAKSNVLAEQPIELHTPQDL